MVEGPGCKLKGEKIKSKLLKQKVKAVQGNAVEREEKNLAKKRKRQPSEESSTSSCRSDDCSVTPFHRIIEQPLDEVLTLGKELFMFFGSACLRIHFLMAGSFRVNDKQVDTDGGKKIPATSSLEIQFAKDKLTFYKCAAEIRPASACRQKYANLRDLDICSPTFSPNRALTEIMQEQDRQLCDVLLDQDILPGVGNIIKNEALFDSGLRPDSKVKDLTEEHILHLVKMTRDFSMLFYKCRKNGTNLREHMRVYQKGKCGECESKIVMTRMGDDNERVTYFCPSCQTNNIKQQKKLKLPTKNSLLGWVQKNQTSPGTGNHGNQDWSCSVCTLINPANLSNCSVCLSTRGSQVKADVEDLPQTESVVSIQLDSSEEDEETVLDSTAESSSKANSLSAATATTKRKQPVETVSPESYGKKRRVDKLEAKLEPVTNLCSVSSVERGTGGGFMLTASKLNKDMPNSVTSPLKLPSAARKTASASTTTFTPVKKTSGSSEQKADTSNIPACSCNGRKCAMRQSFKENENKGRWFFTCATMPASKRCKFFQWADVGFPTCSGHGKVCAFRTVMKQGPNNGRRFFCCPVRNKGCSYFEWAVGYG